MCFDNGTGNQYKWARPAQEDAEVPKNKALAIASLKKVIESLTRTVETIDDFKHAEKVRQDYKPGSPPKDWQPTPVAPTTCVVTERPGATTSPSSDNEFDSEDWEGAVVIESHELPVVKEPMVPIARKLAWAEHACRKLDEDIENYRWFIQKDVNKTVRLLELHFDQHPSLKTSETWMNMRRHQGLSLLPPHLHPGNVENVRGDGCTEHPEDAPVEPDAPADPRGDGAVSGDSCTEHPEEAPVEPDAPADPRKDSAVSGDSCTEDPEEAPVEPDAHDAPVDRRNDDAVEKIFLDVADDMMDDLEDLMQGGNHVTDEEWHQLEHRVDCLPDEDLDDIHHLAECRNLTDQHGSINRRISRTDFEFLHNAVKEVLEKVANPSMRQPDITTVSERARPTPVISISSSNHTAATTGTWKDFGDAESMLEEAKHVLDVLDDA